MYIQGLYRNNSNQSISTLIEIDSWASAGMKLPDLYSREGYNLVMLQSINFSVDPWDTTLPLYLCRYEFEGTVTNSYIFANDVKQALSIVTEKLGATALSITLTTLNYRDEKN